MVKGSSTPSTASGGPSTAPAKGHEQRHTRRHGWEAEWQVRGGFDEPLAREMTACQEIGQRGTRHERYQCGHSS